MLHMHSSLAGPKRFVHVATMERGDGRHHHHHQMSTAILHHRRKHKRERNRQRVGAALRKRLSATSSL